MVKPNYRVLSTVTYVSIAHYDSWTFYGGWMVLNSWENIIIRFDAKDSNNSLTNV